MSATIYHGIPSQPLPDSGRALGIGVYDGVHQGHQAVVGRVLEEARALNLPAALFTFDRLPEEVLRPEVAPKRLMDIEEKLEALEALGPDEILVVPVTQDFLRQTPNEFATRTLCGIIDPRVVVVGIDFRYGRGARGTTQTLADDAQGCGFRVVTVDPVLVDGEKVSSTRIRNLITDGKVDMASRLLTRPYRITGKVERGDGRGRQIGFPTANLVYPTERLLPGRGVYACRATGDGFTRAAAVNIGVRPTIDPHGDITVEAHLLDFDQELYGQTLTLEFIERLREERRFPSLESLKDQLAQDVARTRRKIESI